MGWREITPLLLLLGGASASILELNGTMLRSMPPLYALDNWADCQAPGDVYCIVDAKLVSTEPSPLLSFLEEYSKQTLKHYNRTLIHRGVCVTRCGTAEPDAWRSAARRCLNSSLHKYGLEAEIQSVGWCSVAEAGAAPAPAPTAARALAVLCTVVCALAALATALHLLQPRIGKTHGNKFLVAFSLKQNWQILTYDRSKPRSDDRMKDVACIEGIRVLGMQCVIFSHVIFIYLYSYVENPEYVEKMYDQLGWKVVMNSPLWLQAFFSISGFLTAYSVLISSDTQPVTLLKCLMSIVSRWIRLTPVSVFALWFTIAWFPRLGSGPQWGWLVQREADDCAERWWYHALYLHNHLPTGKFCMGHTWYLAADMQLHALGVLLLLALSARPRAALAVLGALAAAAALAAGLTAHLRRLLPIGTAQAPEVIRTMFLGSDTLTQLYLPAWMNLPGYAGGVATAFLLRAVQRADVKLAQNKWFSTAFHLSLPLGGAVVAGGAWFLADAPAPRGAAALYAALDRSLVALAFNIFLLGCLTNCTSVLAGMLRWRGWHVLGRLSFCVFVVHFIVLRLTLAAHARPAHADLLSLVSLLMTSSVLSYLAAVPLCLLVELPALQLWKALAGEGQRVRAPASTAAPASAPASASTPDFKPLDLLANVIRRHDV